MKKILGYLKFGKEIFLLNSYSYLAKVFLSILTAYIIADHNPLLRKDLISVLFGLALTLEQTNYTSIKNGYDQFISSVLGGLSAALIVFLFGINFWTVALSVTFAVFVALKVNWRSVSPVAIFTAIYMTQYVQKDLFGNPSMLLTFRLRITALSFGIAIALFYNFIFSLFFYNKFLIKRVYLILDKLYNNVDSLLNIIEKNQKTDLPILKEKADELFGLMNWLFILFKDYTYDYKMKKKLLNVKDIPPSSAINMLLFSRNITHYISDITMVLGYARLDDKDHREIVISELKSVLDRLDRAKQAVESRKNLIEPNFEEKNLKFSDPTSPYCRLMSNIYEIKFNLSKIEEEISDVF